MTPTLLALAVAGFALQAQAQFAPGGPTPGGTPPGGTTPGGGTPPGGTTPGTGTAAATLVGSTVTVSYLYPDTASALVASSATVDASAVEFACPDTTLALCDSTSGLGAGLVDGESLDIGATTLTGTLLASFDASAGTSFNGLVFSGLSLGSGYTLAGFTLSTNIVGLDSSDISYTASSLSLNLMGLDPSVTTDGSAVGSFTITLLASAVPEPEPAALLAAGLLTLGLLRRKGGQARSNVAAAVR
ncbi:hypothetical protein [Aquabacterium sp. OR-4]|uniref:hypothetical protein n=1 Tax=Aquabacterium sp. OR-4 TaxID=2978127 RepID=UPI0028CAAEBD|nr:hypothetical protein [Aquabacterium sp. OR-4]MDT7834228.1 hypothetical protein [Aquabacterium sp. OR-4]